MIKNFINLKMIVIHLILNQGKLFIYQLGKLKVLNNLKICKHIKIITTKKKNSKNKNK